MSIYVLTYVKQKTKGFKNMCASKQVVKCFNRSVSNIAYKQIYYNTKRRYSVSEHAKMVDPTMWLANGGRK